MSTQVIVFHYTLKNQEGEVLDTSVGGYPLEVFLGSGQIISGLERRLEGLSAGDTRSLVVPAVEAYGERDEDLVVTAKLVDLRGRATKVGDSFRCGDEDDDRLFVVTSIKGDEVHLDGNHPLAGVELHFDIQVTEARPATEEEIACGKGQSPSYQPKRVQ